MNTGVIKDIPNLDEFLKNLGGEYKITNFKILKDKTIYDVIYNTYDEILDKNKSYLLFYKEQDVYKIEKFLPKDKSLINYTYSNEINFYNHCFENIKTKPNILFGLKSYSDKDTKYLLNVDVNNKAIEIIQTDEKFIKSLKSLSLFMEYTDNKYAFHYDVSARDYIENEDKVLFFKGFSSFINMNLNQSQEINRLYKTFLEDILKVRFPKEFNSIDLGYYDTAFFSALLLGIKEKYGELTKEFIKDLKYTVAKLEAFNHELAKNGFMELDENQLSFEDFFKVKKNLTLYASYILSLNKFEWIFRNTMFTDFRIPIKFSKGGEDSSGSFYRLSAIESKSGYLSKIFSFYNNNKHLFEGKLSLRDKLETYYVYNKFLYRRKDIDSEIVIYYYQKELELFSKHVKDFNSYKIYNETIEFVHEVIFSNFKIGGDKIKTITFTITDTILNFYKEKLDNTLNDLVTWQKFKNDVNMDNSSNNNLLKLIEHKILSKNLNVRDENSWKKELENYLNNKYSIEIARKNLEKRGIEIGL